MNIKKITCKIFIFIIIITLVSGCSSKKYNENQLLRNNVEVGDYIYIKSNQSNATVSKDLTGCEYDQKFVPTDLNIYRVLSINSDLTIDVIAEYLPYEEIEFCGIDGYSKYVGTLNYIADSYANKKIVEKARNFGYVNQHEDVTEIKSYNEYISNIKNKSYNEIKKYNEEHPEAIYGLKLSYDDAYKKDADLTVKVLGTLNARPRDNDRSSYAGAYSYFVSSRSSAPYMGRPSYTSFAVKETELYYGTDELEISDSLLFDCDHIRCNGEDNHTKSRVRPVLTLKRQVYIKSGDGKSESTAYVLDTND